jgi:hypothetical protein
MLNKSLIAAFVAGVSFIITSCTYLRPATITPPPNRLRTNKSFFMVKAADGSLSPKRFLCGWYPEHTAGTLAHLTLDHHNQAGHCNMEFEITERALLGRLVQPSYPTDKNPWPVGITIPITRHYYEEEQLDTRGRNTNEIIENSGRSDWSARPYMDLDFTNVRVHDPFLMPLGGSLIPSVGFKADDIEWDHSSNFLAFTVTMMNGVLGSLNQANMRFNFLEFKTNPEFTQKQMTLYHEENSKYFNALHIVGKKLDGVHPVMYVAKWDVRKQRDLHLVNFPPEHQGLGIQIIKEWNQVFECIHERFDCKTHGRDKAPGVWPFTPRVVSRKYTFDMRHPSIVWVSDKRQSYNGPLGIGMATADVENGEILWGGVTIWGGALENYVRTYLPPQTVDAKVAAQLGEGVAPQVQLSLGLPQLDFQPSLAEPPVAPIEHGEHLMRDRFTALVKNILVKDGELTADQTLSSEQQSKVWAAQGQFSALTSRMTEKFKVSRFNQDQAGDQLQRILGKPTMSEMTVFPGMQTSQMQSGGLRNMSSKQIVQQAKQQMIRQHFMHDLDRSFAQSAVAWQRGLNQSKKSVSEALPAIIKDLLLHEVGHMLGMGHNFKENILPKPGTVPQKYYVALKKDADAGHLNYSTVMGYKHGVTDILTDVDHIKPGIHDELLLRYIYRRQVATFKQCGTDYVGCDEDFTFVDLPADGQVRTTFDVGGRELKTSYFPQCNDIVASIGSDPFCARWDRGHTATTITQNHFDDFRSSVVSQLQSFSSDTVERDPYFMEYILWERSLNTFGRTRLFYDFMRQRYANFLRSNVLLPGSEGERRLLQFANTCSEAYANPAVQESDSALAKAMKEEGREFLDLCKASSLHMDELVNMVRIPGSDFTQFNRDNARVVSSMTGGDVTLRWSRIFGKWSEMGRAPIRVSALISLLLPYPTQMFYGYLMPMGWDQYTGRDGYFHLSTLYPREYTQLIASAVESNLSLGANSSGDASQVRQSTSLGQAVLALATLLPYSQFTNDKFELEARVSRNLRRQSEFRYNFGALEITRKDEEGKELAKEFTGKIHVYGSSNTIPVQDVFMYRDNAVIAVPYTGTMLYPVSPEIMWISQNTGVYYVLTVDYPRENPLDTLRARSVKNALTETYQQVLKSCVDGTPGSPRAENGLRHYFTRTKPQMFAGFDFPRTINTSDDAKDTFLISIEREFDKYYKSAEFLTPPDPRSCNEALRGQGLLVSTAAALNGFFLPEILNYIERGN